MARLFLSQTLIRASSQSSSSSSSFLHLLPVSPRILSHRHRSDQTGKAQLIEVDLDSSSSSSNDDVEVLGIRKLEDMIHNIIVKRSAPDWLSFIPGSSYWVPPRPSHPHDLVQVIRKLTNPLTDDESLSLSTIRGWPSSSYFIQGTSSPHPVTVEVKVEVLANKDSENAAQWNDEDR